MAVCIPAACRQTSFLEIDLVLCRSADAVPRTRLVVRSMCWRPVLSFRPHIRQAKAVLQQRFCYLGNTGNRWGWARTTHLSSLKIGWSNHWELMLSPSLAGGLTRSWHSHPLHQSPGLIISCECLRAIGTSNCQTDRGVFAWGPCCTHRQKRQFQRTFLRHQIWADLAGLAADVGNTHPCRPSRSHNGRPTVRNSTCTQDRGSHLIFEIASLIRRTPC